MAHTPGPWSAETDAYGDVRVRAPSGRGRDEVCIAVVQPSFSSDIREANARLIAAAPEMLEALKAFVAYDDGADRDDVDQMLAYGDALALARAAIAKAEQGK